MSRLTVHAVIAGCAVAACAAPATGLDRGTVPSAPESFPEEVVARAREAFPDPINTGVLYPPTSAIPDGAYGSLAYTPSVVRRIEDGWLVAFAYACPADPERGRVFHVGDHGDAVLLYPPILLPSLEPASLDDEGLAARGVVAVQGGERPEAVGLWLAPFDADGARRGPGPFVYDGRSVTMHFWPRHLLHFRAEDEMYRVEASWSGDVLRIRFPYGAVEDLARFRDGRFESLPANDDEAVVLERIVDPAAIVEAFGRAEVVRPRPLHDYDRTRAWRCHIRAASRGEAQ